MRHQPTERYGSWSGGRSRFGLVALLLLGLTNCSESPHPTGFDSTHGGIAVSVQAPAGMSGPTSTGSALPIAALGPATTPTLDCVGMGIGVITINVRDSGGALVKGEDFSCQHGNGIIDNLPAGSGYQVEMIGRPQQGGPTVWSGTQAPVTVSGGAVTPVTITNFGAAADTVAFTVSPSSIPVGSTSAVTAITFTRTGTPVFQNFPPLGMQFFSSTSGSCSGSPTPDTRVIVEANGTITAIGGTGNVTICASYAGLTAAQPLTITTSTAPLPPFALAGNQTVMAASAGGAVRTVNLSAKALTGAPQLTLSVLCPEVLVCAVADTGQQPNNTLYPSMTSGTPFAVTVQVNPNYQGTGAPVPPGFYLMTVQGVATGYTVAARYTLAVQVIPPPGALTAASGDVVVAVNPGVRNLPYGQGLSAAYTVTVTLQGGTGGNVTLSATGCPTGLCTFSPNPVALSAAEPSKTATLTVPTTVTTNGSIPLTIQAGTAQATALLTLTTNVASTWIPTGSLANGRYEHRMVLLNNGKVLVVGGRNGSGPLASFELYDPTANNGIGSWSQPGSMATPRQGHTATRLQNGKVLVAGGINTATLNTAELYDPATGQWTTTGNLTVARRGHTATLLPNGRVLVAGGGSNTAELYDPITNQWAVTGSPTSFGGGDVLREALLLLDGRVLVVGGQSNDSVDLYDPNTGQWSAGGSLGVTTNRDGHTLTLLPNGKVLIAGGHGIDNPSSLAWIYDPATGLRPTGGLLTPRGDHTATLLPDGKVLIAGGNNGISWSTPMPLLTTEIYDPSANSGLGAFSLGSTLTVARSHHTATLLPNGKVLEAGGYATVSSAEVFSLSAGIGVGVWLPTGGLATARSGHTETRLLDGRVLVVGGQTSNGTLLATAELYDPSTGAWTVTGSMGSPRADHSATRLQDGRVLVVCGRFTGSFYAEIYNPSTGQWADAGLPSIARSRYSHTATLLPNGTVLVAGGFRNIGGDLEANNTADLYNPSGNNGLGTWTTVAALMANGRARHAATALSDGRVLLTGGIGTGVFSSTFGLASAELFDPLANSGAGGWSSAGNMSILRSRHTATILANGRVLIVGGSQSYTDNSSVLTAELYQPDSTNGPGSWGPAASLTTNPRNQHTATLLPNGKVLISGGWDGGSVVGSAELYDPAAANGGAWSPMGSMTVPRKGHTTTLLPNGNLLTVGGAPTGGTSTNNAEIFALVLM